jgi:hypothetical protein
VLSYTLDPTSNSASDREFLPAEEPIKPSEEAENADVATEAAETADANAAGGESKPAAAGGPHFDMLFKSGSKEIYPYSFNDPRTDGPPTAAVLTPETLTITKYNLANGVLATIVATFSRDLAANRINPTGYVNSNYRQTRTHARTHAPARPPARPHAHMPTQIYKEVHMLCLFWVLGVGYVYMCIINLFLLF